MNVRSLSFDLTHVKFQKFASGFRYGNDSDDGENPPNADLEQRLRLILQSTRNAHDFNRVTDLHLWQVYRECSLCSRCATPAGAVTLVGMKCPVFFVVLIAALAFPLAPCRSAVAQRSAAQL